MQYLSRKMYKEKLKDKTIELLDKYLDSDYMIYPIAPNKSSKKDIEEVEKNLGIKFPKEYITHLLGEKDEILGDRGIYIEVKKTIWKRVFKKYRNKSRSYFKNYW